MSQTLKQKPTTHGFAKAAIKELGWWRAHKFLFLRRLSQVCVFALFAISPFIASWAGVWLLKGNLSASELFGVVPLSDPLATLQVLMTGHLPELSLILGAVIIVLLYAVLGGRVFCSWVCPVNMVTDLASWLRRKMNLPRTAEMPRNLRYYLLALVLILPVLTGMTVWEWLNPVPILYRAVLFGAGSGLWILAAIFLLDLFISERAWCGHLCPTGALFGLIGKVSPVKVSAVNAKDCDNCMDCFVVCPERQVLKPALKGKQPMITDSDCTQCGRCIDVCAQRVFQYQNRIALKAENNQ
ncbi:quinol dehydrogenase ferredoxin subunit NapH [Shewanella schlegeliana]|uniref:Quinol dehydrogenase ferredoxin subunit NapH n=1 Tax=Shewanella schlegeliana TaxID=190308 RepID=A0ABS1SVL0_9GAMM|nr:quinol dehydrogenase ferredoxin subunit NapH [Shewanella schlegeliana]MBL4912548.1 quinol dehydrogenase ferredoxin subunit NapH [Shewanella schlegeliana]MCL1107982.1 quinol dehydrogenase ferredoxin subunit NapH [Shewanella schlegeliana]GIU21281.1 quinol dehydrogenase ferredoxin subunit NapH [Shewanella schlegeliana]